MKQIYLDNGATSFPKAPGVGQAMKDYIEKVGVNVNRSSYRATAEAALSTLTVREDLCRLFGAGEDPSYAIFTSGVTMSLNMIMKGALHPGDHLIISGMEHNAVARPATQLEAAGVAVSIAPAGGDAIRQQCQRDHSAHGRDRSHLPAARGTFGGGQRPGSRAFCL